MTELQKQRESTTRVFFIIFFMAAFFSYALYVGLFGTLAVPMMDYYGIDSGAQGVFTMMGSIGGIVSAFIFALMGDRFHKLRIVALGMLLLTVGTFLLSTLPAYGFVCMLAVLCGFAYTAIDVMGNSSVTEYFGRHSTLLLPMVQIVFGIGTVSGPLLMVALYKEDSLNTLHMPFLVFAVLFLIITVLYYALFKREEPLLPKINFNKMAQAAKKDPAAIFRSKKTWVMLSSHTLFNCLFMGVISWLPTFFQISHGMSTDGGALMLTLFYVGNLGMRIISPPILKKLPPHSIYTAFTIIGAACMIGAFNVSSSVLAVILTIAGGAFLSLDVVCLIMIATAFFPQRKASASSLAVFAFNIGGFVAPAAVGFIAQTYGYAFPLTIMAVLAIIGGIIMGTLCAKCKTELAAGLIETSS